MTRSRRQRRMRGNTSRALTNDSTIYGGPVRLPTGGGLDKRTTRANVSVATTMSTSAGGTAAGTFSSDPGSTTDWSSLSAIYQEYRVLGFEVEYVPYETVPVSGSRTPGAGAMDYVHYAGATTPASLDGLLQNANHTSFHTHRPAKVTWRMRGVEEATWQKMSVAQDHGSIRWYIDGLTASASYGRFFVTYLVELRGRI